MDTSHNGVSENAGATISRIHLKPGDFINSCSLCSLHELGSFFEPLDGQ